VLFRSYETANDESQHDQRLSMVGTYDSNNSTLAYVNEQGQMITGHSTSENMDKLRNAGYRRGSIWVPFSNGEIPTDPDQQKQYLDMRERGRELNRQETSKRHLEIYQQRAEQEGIKPVKDGVWASVDGVEWTGYGGSVGKIDENTNGYNMPMNRLEMVGTYDSNNGRLAYVDHEGKMHVGASTTKNYNALRDAGYKSGGIWVPFSNGEVPTDQATREAFRDIFTGLPKDELEMVRNQRADEVIGLKKGLFGEVAVIPDRDELIKQVADHQEIPYRSSDSVVERYSPRSETDQAGFDRTVYSGEGFTFSFKGREELPIYGTAQSSRSELLGEAPNWVTSTDFATYKSEITRTQENANAEPHYIVNKTLDGVLELAIKMGATDPELPGMISDIQNGIYSDRALRIMDGLIAGNYINKMRWGSSETVGTSPEVVMALALTGNQEAQDAMLYAYAELASFDESKRTQSMSEQGNSSEHMLNPAELCCVHATRFLPSEGNAGDYLVPTTFDATHGKTPRNTVHTSLNHKVGGHMYGSWDDAGYVIISPFSKMIEANGVPAVLNTVDTYWDRSPGERLVFADATLVAPGGSDIEGMFHQEGNVVRFKSEGYQVEDITATQTLVGESRSGYDAVTSGINEAVTGAFGYPGESNVWDLDQVGKSFNRVFKGTDDLYIRDIDFARQIIGDGTGKIEDRVRALAETTGLRNALRVSDDQKSEEIEKFVKKVSDGIRGTIYQLVNQVAVNNAIQAKGFSVKPSGMWAWGDSWDVTAQTGVLGKKIGSRVGAHTNMVEHTVEDQMLRAIGSAHGTYDKPTDFKWDTYMTPDDTIQSNLPDISKKQRQVIYASGLLNARSGSSKKSRSPY
jgi:hypothetical protein